MQTREQLFVDGKLQIIVLGEVPDSVPAEAEDDEEIDVDETDEDATPETSNLLSITAVIRRELFKRTTN